MAGSRFLTNKLIDGLIRNLLLKHKNTFYPLTQLCFKQHTSHNHSRIAKTHTRQNFPMPEGAQHSNIDILLEILTGDKNH